MMACSTTNNRQPFDYGSMVRSFVALRSRMAALRGAETACSAYYDLLASFGLEHSNGFRTAAQARMAYRILAATLRRWEAAQQTRTPVSEVAPASQSPTKGYQRHENNGNTCLEAS